MTRPLQIPFIYLRPYSYMVTLDFFCILEVSYFAAPSECQVKFNLGFHFKHIYLNASQIIICILFIFINFKTLSYVTVG
jgi:hypothetical protein